MFWKGDAMKPDKPINWAALMQSALRLGVPPQAFWALSLREWQLITDTQKKPEFRGSDLSKLISAFPDTE